MILCSNFGSYRRSDVNDRNVSKGSNAFLVTALAPPGARRRALAVVIVLFSAFCALIPFARIPLPRIEPLLAIFEAIFTVNTLLTAASLCLAFRRSRLRAVLSLASWYLFTSLMAVPIILTFPGVFTYSGLLGADAQTSAWLDTFRNAGFPLLLTCYALLTRCEVVGGRSLGSTAAAIVWATGGAVAGVCVLTVLATAGDQLLPRIMVGDGYTTAMVAVNAPVCLLCLAALAVLGSRRPHSILDLWLMVVVVAWMFDGALSTILNAGRFDIGFYAGRLYGLLATSFVPIALLVEASRLYGRLDQALAVAEERNAELARSREALAQAQRLETSVN
jgi:hypothetical protein